MSKCHLVLIYCSHWVEIPLKVWLEETICFQFAMSATSNFSGIKGILNNYSCTAINLRSSWITLCDQLILAQWSTEDQAGLLCVTSWAYRLTQLCQASTLKDSVLLESLTNGKYVAISLIASDDNFQAGYLQKRSGQEFHKSGTTPGQWVRQGHQLCPVLGSIALLTPLLPGRAADYTKIPFINCGPYSVFRYCKPNVILVSEVLVFL